MNEWKLKEFNNIVTTFLENCDSDMKEVLEQRLDSLSEMGIKCGWPVSKPLGGGFFELRAKENRRQVRLIYYFKPNKVIIFVHAFYKTTRNIPPRDIEKAKKNKKFSEEEEGKVDEINFTN